MKKRKLKVPVGVLILGIFAVLLFSVSTVGGARAALTIRSAQYVSQFEMYHIGITLNEKFNGNPSEPRVWRNYQNEAWYTNQETSLLQGIGTLKVGQPYEEELTITNSGSIKEFVRVTVRKYWVDENGNKDYSLDPSLIELRFTPAGGWIVDPVYTENDPERTVMYYTPILGMGETTPPFADQLTLSPEIKNYVKQTTVSTDADGRKTVHNYYTYDGKQFVIDVQADGVQTHNAEDAIRSAWGREVTVSDGVITALN